MSNTMIELISDDELIDLLIDTAHTTPTISESNFLDVIREELKSRLSKVNHVSEKGLYCRHGLIGCIVCDQMKEALGEN